MKIYKLIVVTLVVLTSQISNAQSEVHTTTSNHISIKAKMDSTLNKLNLKKSELKGTKNEEAPMTNPETKAVFFVHGLAGGAGTWDAPRDWTRENYNVHSPTIDYAYSSKLDFAAGDVLTEFFSTNQDLGENYDHESSIYIAHSMGGTLGLQINYEEKKDENDPEYGAMATFGSPLAGAPVVNNSRCFNDLMNEGCLALTAPIITESLKNISKKIQSKVPGFLKGVLNGVIQRKILDLEPQVTGSVCSFTPLAFSFLEKDILPAIGHDLDPEGPVIERLKDHEVTISSIAYWGIEDEPVSLRQIYSLQHNVNTPMDDPDHPEPKPTTNHFTADYDEGFIDVMNDLKDEMEAKAKFWRTRKNCSLKVFYPNFNIYKRVCEAQGGKVVEDPNNRLAFICVLCFSTPDNDHAKKYDKAAQWLRDFDNKYRECFGLDETIYEENTKLVCRCYFKNNGPLAKTYELPCDQVNSKPGDIDGGNVFECRDEDIIIRTKTMVRHTADGVVPSWSAKKINVADGVYFEDFDMPGSNHQQIRNDKNAGEHFPKMFRGDYHADFKLNR